METVIGRRTKMEADMSKLENNVVDKSFCSYTSKLSCVFDAMSNAKEAVHDDTLLEKMADWIESFVVSPESVTRLLNETSCCAYLDHVQNPKALCPPDRLVLGLRLAAHLASQNWAAMQHLAASPVSLDGESNALLCLWRAAQLNDHWQHGGVRDAWLRGLQKLLPTDEGLRWIYENGFLSDTLKLLSDPSMFVSKTAKVLSAMLLVYAHSAWQLAEDGPDIQLNLRAVDKDGDGLKADNKASPVNSDSDAGIKAISNTIFDHIFNNESKTTISTLGIEVLEMALHQTITSKTFWIYLQKHWDLSNSLRTRVLMDKQNRPKTLSLCTNIWSYLIQADCLTPADEVWLCSLPAELALQGDIMAVVTMASWRIATYPDMSKNDLDWFFLPLRAVLADPSQQSPHYQLVSQQGGRPIRQYLTILSSKVDQLPPNCQQVLLPQLCAFLHQMVSGDSPPWLKVQGCLQQQILQTCCSANLHLVPASDLQNLIDSSLKLLQSGQTSASLVQWGCHCLIKCLEASSKESCQVPQELHSTLLRSLCHPNWEIRDTSLQSISGLIDLARDGQSVIMDWLVESRLAHQVWLSCKDGESYVRASALLSLGQISRQSPLWESLLQEHSQEEVVNGVVKIILEDTEGFARRAALDVVSSWSDLPAFSSHRTQMYALINSSIHDLDWEVKLLVLKFWEQHLDKVFCQPISVPGYNVEVMPKGNTDGLKKTLEGFGESGCYKTIATAFRDHDPSVQHKAYAIVDKLCRTLKEKSLYKSLVSGAENSDSDTSGEPSAKKFCKDGDRSETNIKCITATLGLSKFLGLIESFDLDRCLRESAQSSDEYQRNPQTLLDDILTCLRQNSEDTTIDCY